MKHTKGRWYVLNYSGRYEVAQWTGKGWRFALGASTPDRASAIAEMTRRNLARHNLARSNPARSKVTGRFIKRRR